HARPVALARADLRRFALGPPVTPARHLLRGLRPGPVPDALRAAELAAVVLALHARMGGGLFVSVPVRDRVRPLHLALVHPAGDFVDSGRRAGVVPEARSPLRRRAKPVPACFADLPRPAAAVLRALQVAA